MIFDGRSVNSRKAITGAIVGLILSFLNGRGI